MITAIAASASRHQSRGRASLSCAGCVAPPASGADAGERSAATRAASSESRSIARRRTMRSSGRGAALRAILSSSFADSVCAGAAIAAAAQNLQLGDAVALELGAGFLFTIHQRKLEAPGLELGGERSDPRAEVAHAQGQLAAPA